MDLPLFDGYCHIAGPQIDPHRGAGRSYRAGDNIWLGELGNDLLALQLEPLTIQGDATDDDCLAVSRPYAPQPPIIGNRERDPWRRRCGKGLNVDPRVSRQKKSPIFPVVAAPNCGAAQQLQPEQIVGSGERASVHGAGIIEPDAPKLSNE